MKHNKQIIAALILCLVFSIYSGTAYNVKADDNTKAEGVYVDYHTQDEIRAYIKKSGTPIKSPVTYAKTPVASGTYSLGALSDETLESSLKMINQIRYIAGLSHNITLNQEYTQQAQAAALVNAAIGTSLSHYPERPANMSDELYYSGYTGSSHSNLSAGYGTLNEAIIYGQMSDSSSSNISSVGHRRWILNPSMTQTGFGAAENSDSTYIRWYAVYALDYTGEAEQRGVIWPAQNIPIEYFSISDPWSISIDRVVDSSKVKVSLTRLSDNQCWEFSDSKSDGYFNVNNGLYGQTGCIIFRPDDINQFNYNDTFQVTITGLDEPVSYNVNFFYLYPVESVTLNQTKLKMNIGEHILLERTVLPENATIQRVKLESSDPSVVEIDLDSNGYIKAVGYGTAKVTVTSVSSGIKAVCTVTVPKPVTELTAEQIPSRKYTGQAIKPGVTVMDGETVLKLNTDYTLSYSGNIKAGTATVAIKGKNNYEGTLKVKFSITAKLKLNKTKLSLKKQNTYALEVTSKEKADAVAAWKSSNSKCVKVDETGKITALKAGTATITVTMESGAKASCVVTVTN